MDHWYTKTLHSYPCLFADIDADAKEKCCAILKFLAGKPGDPMRFLAGNTYHTMNRLAHLKCDGGESSSVPGSVPGSVPSPE